MKNVPYLAASAKRWEQSSCPNNKLGSFRIHTIVGMSKTRYEMRRHFCYVGRDVLFSTLVLLISATALLFSASTLLLCATALQYCTVSSGTYCAVSYSFIITGLGIPIVI